MLVVVIGLKQMPVVRALVFGHRFYGKAEERLLAY